LGYKALGRPRQCRCLGGYERLSSKPLSGLVCDGYGVAVSLVTVV
jgi:hypothetical protein